MQSGQNANTAVKSWRDWDRNGFKKSVLTLYMWYLQESYSNGNTLTAEFNDNDLAFMVMSGVHTSQTLELLEPESSLPASLSSLPPMSPHVPSPQPLIQQQPLTSQTQTASSSSLPPMSPHVPSP